MGLLGCRDWLLTGLAGRVLDEFGDGWYLVSKEESASSSKLVVIQVHRRIILN